MNILYDLPTPTEPAASIKTEPFTLLDALKVGEFTVTELENIRVYATRASKRLGRKFKVNQIPGGYRVTRVR